MEKGEKTEEKLSVKEKEITDINIVSNNIVHKKLYGWKQALQKK